MNSSKQMFAIVAVLAMLGAALVGVGYAYNATVQNTGNDASQDYLVIGPQGSNPQESDFKDNFDKKIDFDTVTTFIQTNPLTADAGGWYKVQLTKPEASTIKELTINEEKVYEVGFMALTMLDQGGDAIGESTSTYNVDISIPASVANDKMIYFVVPDDTTDPLATYSTGAVQFFKNGTDYVATVKLDANVTTKTFHIVAGFPGQAAYVKQLSDVGTLSNILDNATVTFKADSQSIDVKTSRAVAVAKSAGIVLDRTVITDATSSSTASATATVNQWGNLTFAGAAEAAEAKYVWSIAVKSGMTNETGLTQGIDASSGAISFTGDAVNDKTCTFVVTLSCYNKGNTTLSTPDCTQTAELTILTHATS